MNNKIISDMHNKYFKSNAATIYMYKSSRKNSKIINNININHLISKNVYVHDDRIMQQLTETIENIVYTAKQYNHIELTVYTSIFKKASYINANNDLYCTTCDMHPDFIRVKFATIEQTINFIFMVYSLIYPYNEIDISDIYNNSSIKYLIKEYYKKAA